MTIFSLILLLCRNTYQNAAENMWSLADLCKMSILNYHRVYTIIHLLDLMTLFINLKCDGNKYITSYMYV